MGVVKRNREARIDHREDGWMGCTVVRHHGNANLYDEAPPMALSAATTLATAAAQTWGGARAGFDSAVEQHAPAEFKTWYSTEARKDDAWAAFYGLALTRPA